MKLNALILLLLGFMTSAAFADTPITSPVVQVSTRPLQAVFVWAIGKNTGDIEDVELDIQSELIKHGVAGERSVKLFPKGMTGTADHILERMRTTGCDSVLVVRRTSTIHWDSEDSDNSSLHSLIAHRAQLLNPKDSLESTTAAPIVVSNITGNGDWQIVEGEAILFDLKSGNQLWRGNTQVKSAKDLPQSKYLHDVAEKVAQVLEKAGFIPIKK
jgi:hypothetical protein